MTLIELWKTSTDTFQKEPNITNKKIFSSAKSNVIMGGLEQFFGALSDLNRGSDFEGREVSIVCDIFIFNKKK